MLERYLGETAMVIHKKDSSLKENQVIQLMATMAQENNSIDDFLSNYLNLTKFYFNQTLYLIRNLII